MELNTVADLIINNGVGVACICYFMFRDYKFMTKITELMQSIQDTLDFLKAEKWSQGTMHED